MDSNYLKKILLDFKKNKINLNQCLDKFKTLPFENLDFAKLDNHRSLRKGSAEVIYCQNKSSEQIIKIVSVMKKYDNDILLTRLNKEYAELLLQKYAGGIYNKLAQTLRFQSEKKKKSRKGKVMVVTAGTSDICVAEECVETLKSFRINPETIYDVGVAGIHRLFEYLKKLQQADVIIAIAGMEGALSSVIGGLVNCPVIAVPTSIGYGANLHGITTLLSMLNSCSSNVSVVNIDNGFGAGYIASIICEKIYKDI